MNITSAKYAIKLKNIQYILKKTKHASIEFKHVILQIVKRKDNRV